jgi:hypothetical protein
MQKELWLDESLEDEPCKARITLAKGIHAWWKWAMPLSNYTLAFPMKDMENLEA